MKLPRKTKRPQKLKISVDAAAILRKRRALALKMDPFEVLDGLQRDIRGLRQAVTDLSHSRRP